MEKKSMQRMIGIFVLVAIVAILLPFFFSKNDSSVSTTSAPPLPEQQSGDPLASNSNQISVIDASNQNQINAQQPAQPVQQAQAEPVAIPPPLPQPEAITAPTEQKTAAAENKQPEPVKHTHAFAHKKKLVALSKHAASTRLVWVIQMGSFKNKDNARRLTDRLRAGGYRAFSKTVRSGTHQTVRVYIGPESRQASAEKLSNQVANYIKIKGIVIPYKPLTL